MRNYALAFLTCLAMGGQAAPAAAQDRTRIPVNEMRTVDAHGVCREITNKNKSPVMIPHRTPSEWYQGTRSFLAEARDGLKTTVCDGTPVNACFVWISNGGPTTENDHGIRKLRIGTVTTWANDSWGDGLRTATLLGAGDYRDAGDVSPPDRVDSIAIGRDARITVYEGKNFTGKVLANISGPRVLLNDYFTGWTSIWIPVFDPRAGEGLGYYSANWQSEDWSGEGPILAQFPPSTRSFMGSCGHPDCGGAPMWAWGKGSIRVTCE